MNKFAVGLFAGALAGAVGGYLAADRGPVTAPVWRAIKAPAVAPQHDPECFPSTTIAAAEDKAEVRSRMNELKSELPAEEIAILANLVREDSVPVPYSGQRAIRSAAILASAIAYDACLKASGTDCAPGRAAHLVKAENADVSRTLGRWAVLTQTDLKKSAFCRLEPVVIQASGT